MGTTYQIFPEIGLLYYKATGHCSVYSVLEVERLAFQDKLRKPDMKILIDVFDADIEFDLNDIKEILAFNKELASSGWALEPTAVFTKSRFVETVSDMFHLLAGQLPIKLKLFHTLKDALTWLELGNYEDLILEAHPNQPKDMQQTADE